MPIWDGEGYVDTDTDTDTDTDELYPTWDLGMGHDSPAAALIYQHSSRASDAAIAAALDERSGGVWEH